MINRSKQPFGEYDNFAVAFELKDYADKKGFAVKGFSGETVLLQSEMEFSSRRVNLTLQEGSMATKSRRRFTADQKVAIVRQHLVDRQSIADLCDQHELRPTQVYQWQKQLFENGNTSAV